MHKPSTTAACVLTRLALLGITPQPLRSEVAEGTCRAGVTAANLNVTLKDINGKPFPLADYKGQVVLLHFSATWCPPCRNEDFVGGSVTRTSRCGYAWRLAPALLCAAVALCLVAPVAGFAQQNKKGAFIDGEWVEDYVYVPDFMTPEELKKRLDGRTPDLVIVDTAARPIWAEGHIPGAVNFPYSKNISAPVPLPRDKTLVIYCACKDHEDSTDVARQLSLLGYRHVKVLKGGWFKWLELKYRTESKDAKKAEKQ